ncbi:MAG: aminotransferase class V-fold PLP-dependent enzyme [Candidatus Promineifilaceae bacterium]
MNHLNPPNFDRIRQDFPRAERKLWFAAAETHLYNVYTLKTIEAYTTYRTRGPLDRHLSFTEEKQHEAKTLFANLINASADEIAFVQSTTDGENIVLAGLDLAKRGGNVVIDDLHFEASKYIYTALAESGAIELRVVPHRNWQTHLSDFEAAIDDETRLVSVAYVSQVNGHVADAKAISEIAHAHGAYFYCDIIQGAGNTPIDVQAMGIDFCACATYKWLMGEFGIGFLYVDKALQGSVVPSTRYGLRQVDTMRDYQFNIYGNANRYEGTSSMSFLAGSCALTGLKYVSRLGVDNIQAHATRLTNRLQRELPRLGYRPITPPNTPSPIVSYLPDDIETTRNKLDKAFGEQVLSFRDWFETDSDGNRQKVRGIRIGVSVYNNDEDVDQLLNALS